MPFWLSADDTVHYIFSNILLPSWHLTIVFTAVAGCLATVVHDAAMNPVEGIVSITNY